MTPAVPRMTAVGFIGQQHHRHQEQQVFNPEHDCIQVTDKETTARFLRDYALTVSDCFMKNCYGRFDQLCREAGLRWIAAGHGAVIPALAGYGKSHLVREATARRRVYGLAATHVAAVAR